MYKVRLSKVYTTIETIIPDEVGLTNLMHLLRDSKVYKLIGIDVLSNYESFDDVIFNLKKEVKPKGLTYGSKKNYSKLDNGTSYNDLEGNTTIKEE